MNNSKTIFTFFSDGQTVNSIKNQAKKAHKANEYKTRSEALNAISRPITNLSFNDAVHKAEKTSPFLLNDTLYFPFFIKEKVLYVFIKDNKATVQTSEEFEDTLSFPFDHIKKVDVSKTKFKSLEKANNGWIYYLEKNEETEESLHLEIYKTDDGLVVDLVCVQEEGENCLSPTTLLSTFAYWNELLTEYELDELL